MRRGTDNRWVELYFSGLELLGEGPGILNRPRPAALELFNLRGIPRKGSGGNDRYHYTDLQEPFAGDYEIYFTPSYATTPLPEPLVPGHRIDLVNGFHRGSQPLTTLANGVTFGSLAAAAVYHPELVGAHYNTLADNAGDATVALSTLFAQDGAFVYVPAGVNEPLPFVVTCALCGQREAVASYARHLFIFEKNASAGVILDYRTIGTERLLGGHTREVIAGPGASVEMAEIFRLNAHSAIVSNSFARQEAQSRLGILSVALGGALAFGNQTVNLQGTEAENHTNALMLTASKERFDLAADIRHNAPDCQSGQQIRCIASEEGTGLFSGRIYVAPGAQRTRAFQQSNGLLLGEGARIRTKPQLEIYADDVKCSHGATVGQLDAEAVYYMRQRGISPEEARRLQLYGFVHEVLGSLGIPGLEDALAALAAEKMNTL